AARVTPALFVVLALLTVLSALTAVVHRNPVHSACALVPPLSPLAALFAGLDAPRVACLQIIVYAGAIVVLFLFVIMLLNLQAESRALASPGLLCAAPAGGIALVALLALVVGRATSSAAANLPAGFGETESVA